MKNGALINSTNTQENTCSRVGSIRRLEGCNFINKETLAHVFSCKFCEIFKNILFIEHLWISAFDFICRVFFIFSIIKNFRNEKRRFVRKKSTSGKPAFFVAKIFDNGKYKKHTTDKIRSRHPEVFYK